MGKDLFEFNEKKMKFYVNMRLLTDMLEREHFSLDLYNGSEESRICGVRLYHGQENLSEQYVYLLKAEEIDDKFCFPENYCFIVLGKLSFEKVPYRCNILAVDSDIDILVLFEKVQDTIEKYRMWDWKLQRALSSDVPLDNILIASMEVFRNPMFIHDSNFVILSDPKHIPAMSTWEMDKRTNKLMVSVSLINDFRTDIEYLKGLKAKKPVLYSAEQTGYRILYRNLWNGDRYEGRVLVDEIYDSIQPGDFYALDYLGSVIEHYIQKRHLLWLSIGNDTEDFFWRCLNENKVDERQSIIYLESLHWKRHDRFMCMKIVTDQEDFNVISSNALLSQIETQVQSGQAFYYENSICVVVNLSYHHETSAQVVSKLAITMREGLLKIGVSSEINDFLLIPQAYKQASIALDFGRNSANMKWYYYFGDYMLEYMVDCASKELPISMLCTEALDKLRKYDEENNAELFRTLETFLRLEKNVLRTSKELFIHRSTLSYRLERIQKVINMNLDDPIERLKLEISYYMMRGISKL
ncbi:MAG: helix-turn-helix domain-containing protein [Blautia sp.]|nr:helix-turn-helix domain-containing protein [Blautia sp.]